MNDQHSIRVRASDGRMETLTVEVEFVQPGTWILIATGAGFTGQTFKGDDLFEALIALRLELERTDRQLLCVGSRIDAFPSALSRAGGARKLYITQMGKQGAWADLLDIFDEADPQFVGTVAQQMEFHTQWGRSLGKQPRGCRPW